MNKIVTGIATVAGAIALSKAKDYLDEEYPEQWARVSNKLNGWQASLLPYARVNVTAPFTIVDALLSDATTNRRSGTTKQKQVWEIMADSVCSTHNCKKLDLDTDKLCYRLACDNLSDHIMNLGFPMSKIDGPGGNFFIVDGQGEYSTFMWMVSRWRAEQPDGSNSWCYYYEESFFKDRTAKKTMENMRKLLWHPRGSLYELRLIEDKSPPPSPGKVFWKQKMPHADKKHEGTEYQTHKAMWSNQIARHRPYNVMLYGKPGCGKSSLLRSWFYENDLRVFTIKAHDLVAAIEEIQEISKAAPDVILVEDIDRLPESEANRLLAFFEHDQEQDFEWGWKWKPMIFTTCNHPSKVPDAIWRPGRVDQIVEVASPNKEEFYKILDAMALGLGLDSVWIKSKHKDLLNEIYETQTIAHLEQLLQRLYQFGIDYEISESDRTFSPPVKWQGK